MPKGIDHPAEARLGANGEFLPGDIRKALMNWWLVKKGGANTPNWDIFCTGEIEGRAGLILVEAKAHDQELSVAGKQPIGNPQNHERIGAAIAEANAGLNKCLPGWNLCRDSHYQLANRFAWGWKVASLGVPVVLVYLGFLGAEEMQDQGRRFAQHDGWEKAVKKHALDIVPDAAWGKVLNVGEVPFLPLIRSVRKALP
ncbi:MAG: hypothetical protein NTZ05_09460 [Chloroflexi bacterium]|nr:hypothetical protein [Chloroflexota bacterium]